MVYFISMQAQLDSSVDLAGLRENAGMTVRELARQLGIHHTTILQWEKAGKVTKAEFLLPMSSLLGVSLEELLGQPKPRRASAPGGKLGQVFRKAAQLPRSQQQRIIDIVEDMIAARLIKKGA